MLKEVEVDTVRGEGHSRVAVGKAIEEALFWGSIETVIWNVVGDRRVANIVPAIVCEKEFAGVRVEVISNSVSHCTNEVKLVSGDSLQDGVWQFERARVIQQAGSTETYHAPDGCPSPSSRNTLNIHGHIDRLRQDLSRALPGVHAM